MNFKRYWDIFQKYKDDRFFNETFNEEIYKPIHDLNHVKTVIDLGALHGEFDLYIYDKADRIFAVEPHPIAFEQLKENCADLEKISIYQLIISNLDGYKYICGDDDGGAHTGSEQSENSTRIESKTLATFMKENNIDHVDVLKIDVEGEEGNIFSSVDFPQVAHKIDFIIGEHPNGNEYLKKERFEIINYSSGWIAKIQ